MRGATEGFTFVDNLNVVEIYYLSYDVGQLGRSRLRRNAMTVPSNNTESYDDFLLTVHLSIILVINQLNAQLYYTASGIITRYRCDDTRCCIIQFSPPDDEHIVPETCRSI